MSFEKSYAAPNASGLGIWGVFSIWAPGGSDIGATDATACSGAAALRSRSHRREHFPGVAALLIFSLRGKRHKDRGIRLSARRTGTCRPMMNASCSLIGKDRTKLPNWRTSYDGSYPTSLSNRPQRRSHTGTSTMASIRRPSSGNGKSRLLSEAGILDVRKCA